MHVVMAWKTPMANGAPENEDMEEEEESAFSKVVHLFLA